MPTGIYEHKSGYKRPPFSIEWKRKIRDYNKGKVLSEDTKKKISLALKGRKLSDEHRKKLRDARKDIIFSFEHCRNISRGQKGKIISLETRKKMSERMKGHLGYNLGKKTPLEVRKKISDSLKRIKPSIKTPINKAIRGGWEYKEWRENIFKRNDYTCQVCGLRGIYLEAHHIKPFALYPKLRFNTENGITLCSKCHQESKGKEEWYENQLYQLRELENYQETMLLESVMS